MKKTTIHDFLVRSQKVHGEKYDYSKVVYKGVDQHVTIVCPIHGEFSQIAYEHTKGRGCKQCGIVAAAKTKHKNTATFIEKAKKVHGDKYDYSSTNYTAAKDKLTIVCPDHGPFEQLASGHLSGYGCKQCTSYGKGRVSSDKPCTVYYLHLHDTGLYKLGITTRTIEERYRTAFDREQFTVVFTKQFATGQEAYDYEQTLFKQHQTQLYKGPKILHSGNTELFITDIFEGTYP